MISYQKSAVFQFGVPLCVMCGFSLTPFNIFYQFFLWFKVVYLRRVLGWISLILFCLGFTELLETVFFFFSKFGKCSAIIYLENTALVR